MQGDKPEGIDAQEEKEKVQESEVSVDMFRLDSFQLLNVPTYRFDVIMQHFGMKSNDMITLTKAKKLVKDYLQTPVGG